MKSTRSELVSMSVSSAEAMGQSAKAKPAGKVECAFVSSGCQSLDFGKMARAMSRAAFSSSSGSVISSQCTSIPLDVSVFRSCQTQSSTMLGLSGMKMSSMTAANLPLRASAIACPLRSSAPSDAHSFCAAFRVRCTNFLAAFACWSHSSHLSGDQLSSQVSSPPSAGLSYIPVPSASSCRHTTAASLARSIITCPAPCSSARCKLRRTYALPALSWPKMLCRMW